MKKQDSKKSVENSNENVPRGDPSSFSEVEYNFPSYDNHQKSEDIDYKLKPDPGIQIHYSLDNSQLQPDENSSSALTISRESSNSTNPPTIHVSQELRTQSTGLYTNLELNQNEWSQVDYSSRTPTSKLEVIDLEPEKQPKKKKAWYKSFNPQLKALNPMTMMKKKSKKKKKKEKRKSKDAKKSPASELENLPSINTDLKKKPNEEQKSEKKETGLIDRVKSVSNKSITGVKHVSNKSISGVKHVSNKSISGVKHVSNKSFSGAKHVSSKSISGVKHVSSKSIQGVKNVSVNTMNMITGRKSRTKSKSNDDIPAPRVNSHTLIDKNKCENDDNDPEKITPSIKKTADQAKKDKQKKYRKQAGQGLIVAGAVGGASLLMGPVVIPVAAAGGIAAYGMSLYNSNNDSKEDAKECVDETCYIDEVMEKKKRQSKEKKTVTILAKKSKEKMVIGRSSTEKHLPYSQLAKEYRKKESITHPTPKENSESETHSIGDLV